MKYILDDKEIEITNFDDYMPLGNDGEFVYVRRKTQEDFNKEQIAELKQKLAETDYMCLKFVDGEITQAEYAETWQKRKQWRKEINKLEKEI